jgi:hypothetical protein
VLLLVLVQRQAAAGALLLLLLLLLLPSPAAWRLLGPAQQHHPAQQTHVWLSWGALLHSV